MKRIYSENVIEIKEIYPLLFWKKCNYCNKEFKKERGYKMSEVYINCKGEIDYGFWNCCNECAESKEKVIDLLNNEYKYTIKSRRKIKLYY